jgi:tetratricopeptide (TPR) repeat protein
LNQAEEYGQQALKLCQLTQSQHDLADVFYTLAGIYRRQNQLTQARSFAQNSLMIFKRMGDRQSQALSFVELSRIDAELHQYVLALHEAEQGLKIFKDINDDWGRVFVLRHLGDTALAIQQPARAAAAWSEAITLCERLKHPLYESINERLQNIKGTAI